MKYLLCALIVSCSHSHPSRDEEFEARLKQLESQAVSASFFIGTDRCFIDYLMCRQKKNKASCWPGHEKCVINEYYMFKKLNK
jgi:hypothetical protein